MKNSGLGLLVAAVVAALTSAGCTTQSYCFSDCEPSADAGPDGTGATGTGGSGTDGGGEWNPWIDTGQPPSDGSSDVCVPGAKELCNGFDDNCNGVIDEGFNVSTDVRSCGGCERPADGGPDTKYDCTVRVKNANQALCKAGPPPACDYDTCAQDFWDLDKDRTNGCEYYCVKKGDTDTTCDNIDDNCDGTPDNGVNKCTDVNNCGKCGRNCQGHPHAVGKCVAQGTPATCDETNTGCELDHCDPGWIDANGKDKGTWPKLDADGCEYACTPKKRTEPANPASALVDCDLADPACGIEYCDGVDNDCNGKIDGADTNMLDPQKGDPSLGKDCYGSLNGECNTARHKGVTKCVAAQVKCVGDNTANPPTACTQDAECTDPARPYCIDAPTPPGKVCGTKVLKVGDQAEVCNDLDDDCDGTKDNSPTDVGGSCGSNIGTCSQGKKICQSGKLECSGQVDPVDELCNGADDNCDGVIDGVISNPVVTCKVDADCAAVPSARFCLNRTGPNDKVCANLPKDVLDGQGNPNPCDVPLPAPAGWTTPCKAGTLTCAGGAKICAGSVKATAQQDSCGQDLNCDGLKSPDFDTQNDVRHCGTCGNDCFVALGGHIAWTCTTGQCKVPAGNKCAAGYIDCDGNANDCEKACTFLSNQELCNGVDDNCDCTVDEMKDAQHPNGIVAPSATQICGVSPAATGACVTGVTVACAAGKWQCSFPAGYCNGGNPPSCAQTPDTCDGIDNNCNGNTDENFKPPILTQGYLGQACNSDDNVTPKHGLCRQSGAYACSGANATACMKNGQPIAGVKLPCGTGAGQSGYACDEECDGKDNDCDGTVDEMYGAKGSNATYWVKPKVVSLSLSPNVWVYAYEASRPSATDVYPGTGNGWWRSSGALTNQPLPPQGTTLDKTPACSDQYRDANNQLKPRVPWFNINGPEAQHLCVEMGGRLCRNSDWQRACRAQAGNCTWGFNANCTTYQAGTSGPCNLGPYDFNPGLAGNQDGLLPTGYLANCYAAWAAQNVFDVTGNLREITCGGAGLCTAAQNSFILMGGAFNTNDPTGEGANCTFTFYNVDASFKLYDVGFRCCFDANPS
jgi:hypothetical protein